MPASPDTRQPAAPEHTSLSPPPIPAAGDALLLDFDGTLVEIADTPDGIRIPAELPDLLARLSEKLEGRLAIVSGRAVADLEKHLGRLPVALMGSHGGEMRAAGASAISALVDPLPEAAVDALHDLAEEQGGLLVERKPCGAAIHFRARPEAEAAVRKRAEDIAENHDLKHKAGKMVSELVVRGADKGAGLRHLLALPRFAGARAIFAGDDVTDEDAFAVASDYAAGGGVLVGPPRETKARWHLSGPPAVQEWLKETLA